MSRRRCLGLSGIFLCIILLQSFPAADRKYTLSRAEYGFKPRDVIQSGKRLSDPLFTSTFLGGSGNDGSWPGTSLVLDGNGNIYVAGGTSSADFPATNNAYDTTYNGGWDQWGADAFVIKIKNLGEVKSFPTAVKFYLSKKPKLNKNSIQIGDSTLASIAPGMKKTIRLSDKLSASITPGSYYLIACVDENDLNHDSKKANNKVSAAKKV